MTDGSRVPIVGTMVGVTAAMLVRPLPAASSWWAAPLVAAVVGGLVSYAVSHGVHRIPGASPKAVATLATVVTGVAPIVAIVVLGSRMEASLQAVVLIVAATAGFRLVIVTVDQFASSFTVSLLAGLAGSVVFAGAVPLLAFAHPDLSVWACMGIAAGIGYLEGILSGVALRPLFVG